MAPADTIVAVSSAAGRAPRAVIRLSGPAALGCIESRFRPAAGLHRTFRVREGDYALTDRGPSVPASVYVMRAPHSYTREDVVELHLPGSPALLDMVLDDLLARDVRLAEAGEFTQRAFMNGRIDLSRAEAVMAVISARSDSELLAATAGLRGATGRRCARLQESITELRVGIEAALDFAAHDIDLMPTAEFDQRCNALTARMHQGRAAQGDALAGTEGWRLVLCGAPNAGKSSLMNQLCGADAAIVHQRPGTTRDVVSADLEIDGVQFRISDTAGLLADATGPDADAVAMARRHIDGAHIVVLVVDASEPAPESARALAGMIEPSRLICALNKCDLPMHDDVLQMPVTLHTSAATGQGVDALRTALGEIVASGQLDATASDLAFNVRQRDAVRRAAEELAAATQAVRDGMGYEFAALNLRLADEALGEITGETSAQDVVNRIFGQFCIGK